MPWEFASVLAEIGSFLLTLITFLPRRIASALKRERGEAPPPHNQGLDKERRRGQREAARLIFIGHNSLDILSSHNPGPTDGEIRQAVYALCDELARLFDSPRVSIYTRDPPDGDFLSMWENVGFGSRQERFEIVHPSTKPPIGCVVRVWLTRTSRVTRRSNPDPDWLPTSSYRPPHHEETEETLLVPLFCGELEDPIAVVCIDSTRPNYFEEEDGQLVSALMTGFIHPLLVLDPQRRKFVS